MNPEGQSSFEFRPQKGIQESVIQRIQRKLRDGESLTPDESEIWQAELTEERGDDQPAGRERRRY